MPLILLPNLLADFAIVEESLPPAIKTIVETLNGLIAESEKGGRNFLRRFTARFREFPLLLLNEHTKNYEELLKPLLKEEKWGLISDAGLPSLADPGAELVFRARKKGVPIITYPGPCSITLALQLSGLSGQRFMFHGYPPREQNQLIAFLRTLSPGITHLFIEAPYRNQKLMEIILSTLKEGALFSIACDLTLTTQEVWTYSISEWRKTARPNIHKRPAIFLLSMTLS